MQDQVSKLRETERATGRGAGILTRNFVFLCVSTAFFFGSFQMMIPTLPLYIERLSGSRSSVGLIVAVFMLTSIVSRPITARLVDKGYASPMMLSGAANFVVSSLGYLLATSVPALLFLRLFHGLGMSAFTTAGGWVLAEIAPPHRRGEASGYYGLAGNIAMASAPAIGVAVLEATNFSVLFAASATAGLMALVLSYFIKVEKKVRPPVTTSLLVVSRTSVPPALVLIAMTIPYGAATTFVPIFAHERGIGNIGLFFAANAIASLLCRPVSGRLADVWGRQAVILPGLIMVAAGVGSLALEPGLLGTIAAGAVMGIGAGFTLPGLLALLIDNAPPNERGSASATFYGGFDMGYALGAGVSGVLADAAGLTAPFIASALITLLGLGYFLTWARRSSAPPPQPLSVKNTGADT